MTEAVVPQFLIPFHPDDIPDLIACWDFNHGTDVFTATYGAALQLQSQSGALSLIDDEKAPLGGRALELNNEEWLNIPRADCPQLDMHGPDGQFTLLAWVKRAEKPSRDCEFIAGQWNESNQGRQYGLFLNIGVWLQPDQVTGHLSHVGGPTPGYKYCIDGPVGSTPVYCHEWACVGMSYDGRCGYAWLNGVLDHRPGLNPYPMSGGLHNGGPQGSDFTVGAVDRSGKIGNFFKGQIAGLAMYGRALTPAEIFALAQL